MKGNIRPIQRSDAELILEWRNTDAVRLNMYNHEVIDIESHLRWFDSILKDNSCQYFIYERDEQPYGVLSFSEIDMKNKRAFWAFYSGDTSVRGVGSEMERLALDYAFNTLGLNKLCCEVLEFNTSVIDFHRKFGFKIEGVKRQDYLRDEKFYDIYQLAIFKKDYLKTQQTKPVELEKSYKWSFKFKGDKIDSFAELSGDKNRIHLDQEFAVKQGFNNKIAHGALLLAEISKVAAMDFPANNPVYLSQNVKYLSPVYPEIELTGEARLKTQIGRFVIIEYKVYQDNILVAICESEFLIS
ncbi:UDP-4-amino-4,6-dideoxy-N-acetyl-beta-L-altrosamine N-acetyltransferase [uncultured Psychrobacter sp.]|uniref:UDP-4-amino-4, 6-dideoxy-N-acetyl-beta-L-altrosamine N-acetyltransferase n=1 Tax=uncultured Psychrobacter sp. TaxID=259303 RepID=UPI0025982E0D|nr:UDP-4-amino-4,6-dideoxy-N-acetyl-beta-L-altrosamine N-acetyltransferase [uncultured Psychrobacter sp.]